MEEKINVYLRDCINRATFCYETVEAVEKVLVKFEGKLITKRVATAIKKVLSDLHVVYDTNAGMYHIKIYQIEKFFHGQRLKDDCISLLLGYHGMWGNGGQNTVSMEKFRESNCGYYLDKERSEKYTQALKKAKRWSKQAKAIKDRYSALYEEMEGLNSHYLLDDLLGFKK